uniref:TFIIS-type domain-containing protein n=1 Tax=Physcomitrium patens TaxID=3218 RepID=A0A2K1IC79_PHYPA|nr:hypothetical protein PHYPA_030363 [Physcomitrium patens]
MHRLKQLQTEFPAPPVPLANSTPTNKTWYVPLVERHVGDYQWYKHFYPAMEVDNTLKSNDTPLITFMILAFKDDNKRTPIKAHFDFSSGVMKIRHVSSYVVSVAELVSMISTTICIDIQQGVEVTNIELSTNVIEEKPDLELLCDVVMNERRLCEIFSLRDKTLLISMKVKYSLYARLGIITFRRGESKTITISNIKNEEHIDDIINQILFLLSVYNDIKDEFNKLYNCIVEEEKVSKHQEVPELFVFGYARECSIKLIIITELEEEKYKSEGRPTMRYPKDGLYSRIYACEIGLFPGLRRNRLPNKDMFEYLPCCYATDHLKRSQSNYYKYVHDVFDEKRSHKKIMRFKPLYPLENDIVGKAPKELQEMMCSTDLRRELWYLTEEEILLNARNRDIFLDPTLYCRALEYIFSTNIYVLDVFDDTSVTMSIPHTKGPYIWEHEYDQSIIVLCYRNVSPYPQCELVTCHWNDTLKQFKMQITICKDALKSKRFIKQKINKDRKCISVLTKSGWTRCLWRPLSVEKVEADEVSQSTLVHAQRLRAYFVHDLYLMCKRWNIVNIRIVRDDVFFVPKIMRETFSTATKFVEYYSSRYPLLFSGGVLRVTRETYNKLKRCYERSTILPLVVSSNEFTRRRNNMISIIHATSHPKGSDKDMIKWYEFNVECMIKRDIKVPSINYYEDINNTIFFDTDSKETAAIVEEGAEQCPECKSKKTMSIDVQKRSADEGMTTMFECLVVRI